ncbi:MAG: transketolase family protein [Streptosporangiaceae bacterium]
MTAASLDPASWNLLTSASLTHSFVAGATLADLARTDPRIVVLGADLKYSNRTSDFAAEFGDRFFNLGIAEQNMVSVAAGMASFGLIPFVGTFASFVGLLCAEQIRTDLAYTGMPVRILAHHAGISLGFYGTSHHATEDVAIVRSIADIALVAPCDARSLDAALRQTIELPGPVYFRIGRGRDPDVYDQDSIADWRFGRATWLTDGADLAVLSYGSTVAPALAAAREAAAEGLAVAVADMHTLKPLDTEAIERAARARLGILVVEEHNTIGGLATAVADVLATRRISAPLNRIGIPDEYAPVGPPTHLYRHYRLDAPGILTEVRAMAGNG